MKQRRDYLQEAVQILTRLSERWPRVPEYRHLLARCLRELHRPAIPFGPGRGEGDQLDRAIRILEELAAEYPQYQFDLAETYALQEHGPQARENLARAITIMTRLVSEQPNVPSYSLSLAYMHSRAAWIQWTEGHWDESLASLRQSVALYDHLIERSPENVKYVLPATLPIMFLAGALRDRGEDVEARDLLEKTIGRLGQVSSGETTPPHINGALSMLHDMLAEVYRDLKEDTLAAQARARADELRPEGFGPPGPRSTSAPVR